MMSITIKRTILVPENYNDILHYYNNNKPANYYTLETRFEGGFGFKVYSDTDQCYQSFAWDKQTINIDKKYIDSNTFYYAFCHAFGEKTLSIVNNF